MTVVVSPTSRLVTAAVTARLVTVAAVTVISTEALCPANAPVIVAVPAATAVTVPDADTVATCGLLDDQVGVTVCEDPSL